MTARAYLTQTSRLSREDRVLEVPKAETAAQRWIPLIATPARPAAVRGQPCGKKRPERDEFRRRHGHGGRLMSQRSGDPDSIGAIFRKKTHH